jgi:hypothetical protein
MAKTTVSDLPFTAQKRKGCLLMILSSIIRKLLLPYEGLHLKPIGNTYAWSGKVQFLHGGLGYIKSLVISFCPAAALTVKVVIN